MKFDEILNVYDKKAIQQINRKLIDLGDKLYGKNKWEFDHSYNSETSASNSGKWYYVTIGKRALTDNCNDTEYNKAGYVLTVKDMYHEQQHVWQKTKAWNDTLRLNTIKSYRHTTDSIRREFIGKYFPSAYYNNYSNDPNEMDAERNGIRCALAYFESDPIISKSEAEEILYELMMSDDCVHKEMLNQYKDRINSIYDVLNIFEERTKTAVNIKYPVTMEIPPDFRNEPEIDLTLTDKFLHSKDFKEYKKAFDTCKTGIEQDKVLEQVILFAYPDIIRKTPLRLRNELLDCKRQMELNSIRPGVHAVSPKQINYSVQTVSEDLKLTDEDIAAISNNNDNINLL